MAYTQATEIQEVLRESAKKPDIPGVALASMARAWLELERLKREIRMKPKPKPVDVSTLPSKKRLPRVSPFAEPTDATHKAERPPANVSPEKGTEKGIDTNQKAPSE